MTKERDVPGNSMASALAYQKSLIKQAEALWRFDRILGAYLDEDVRLTAMRVIIPTLDGDEFRIVLKAERGGEKYVAFHAGGTLIEALVGLLARLENKTLKFKEDQYG